MRIQERSPEMDGECLGQLALFEMVTMGKAVLVYIYPDWAR